MYEIIRGYRAVLKINHNNDKIRAYYGVEKKPLHTEINEWKVGLVGYIIDFNFGDRIFTEKISYPPKINGMRPQDFEQI